METVAPILSSETEFSKISVVSRTSKPTKQQILTRYNLDLIADHLAKHNYKLIALQFPDPLLLDSTLVSEILSTQLNYRYRNNTESSNVLAKLFILADTSYSPCCVDEVAAQHIHADVVVHFGNACLNPVRNIPTVYALNELETDIKLQEVIQAFKSHYTDHDAHIILVADTQYSRILEKLYSELSPQYSNMVLTSLKVPEDDRSVMIPTLESHEGHNFSLLPKRNHPALVKELSEFSMCYITNSSMSSSLILHLSSLVADLSIMNLESVKISTPSSALQKRYLYVNAARAASTIGILVNTLSIKNIDKVLKQVQNWIIQSGKKHYVFVVGKPNVPKLANFDVIDVWVILGCSLGGIIVDCSEYYKPIITPYELNLALQKEIMWSGKWLIDFEDCLRCSLNEESHIQDNEQSNSDTDEPYFDPITGKYIDSTRPLRALEHIQVESDSAEVESFSDPSSTLATRGVSQIAIRGTISTAVEALNKKTWTGLKISDSNSSDHASASKLEQGRKGSARGYSDSRAGRR